MRLERPKTVEFGYESEDGFAAPGACLTTLRPRPLDGSPSQFVGPLSAFSGAARYALAAATWASVKNG